MRAQATKKSWKESSPKMARPIPLSTEGWAEQRRTGYPRFFPAFVNESNGAVNTEEGVRRVIYSSQAYDANAKE